MSLDLSEYPKKLTLKDGRNVTVRPIDSSDEERLAQFLSELSPIERLYYRDDAEDPSIIHRWTHEPDFSQILPLIAIDEDKIVADGALHRSEQTWTRHHGHIRGTVRRGWTGVGLTGVMVFELMSQASKLELERIVVELLDDQRRIRHRFEDLGFTVDAVLKDWVKDQGGLDHDILILSLRVEPAWRKMEELILDYGTHGG